MIVFSSSGAKVFTNVPAMDALVPWRCRISPDMRWEKKAIGIRSTFHISVLLPSRSILPLIFRLLMASTQAAAIWATAISAINPRKGIRSSRFSPVSRRSIKNRENTGLMMPKR